jgi:hypothetical protein
MREREREMQKTAVSESHILGTLFYGLVDLMIKIWQFPKKKFKQNPLIMVTKWQNLGVREGLLLLYGGGGWFIYSSILLRKCNILVPKQFWHKFFFLVLLIF